MSDQIDHHPAGASRIRTGGIEYFPAGSSRLRRQPVALGGALSLTWMQDEYPAPAVFSGIVPAIRWQRRTEALFWLDKLLTLGSSSRQLGVGEIRQNLIRYWTWKAATACMSTEPRKHRPMTRERLDRAQKLAAKSAILLLRLSISDESDIQAVRGLLISASEDLALLEPPEGWESFHELSREIRDRLTISRELDGAGLMCEEVKPDGYQT